jgi:hypothetical protein
MWQHNFLTYSGKIIFQILGEIIYFPIWWYSVGFWRLLKNSWQFLSHQEEILGFSVWAKNIFVPMYGQHDFAGRVISFLMRFIQIIARGLVLAVLSVLVLVIVSGWLALPFFLLFVTIFQISK